MTANLDFEFDTEFLTPEEPAPELAEDQYGPDQPDPDFVENAPETQRAKRYRLKTKHGLNFLLKIFAGNPATVPDAAAIIQYGPAVAQAVGHLADTNDNARRAIDFITDDGIDNPYVLTAFAIMPLVLQMFRNHETVLEKGAKLSIPIGKKRRIRLPFTLRFRLGKMRNVTAEPAGLVEHVFTNPNVAEALRKAGIQLAWPDPRMNGHHR